MEPITVNGPKSGLGGSTLWSDFDRKKNFLIDLKYSSSHKKLINSDIVPISGGVIIYLNFLD